MSKYKNIKSNGFDSRKEEGYYYTLMALKNASNPSERVATIDRQVKYELIPKQDGERAVTYVADFVVTYSDGRKEVIDVKSEMTKKLPVYILKRKLMRYIHNIQIKEA